MKMEEWLKSIYLVKAIFIMRFFKKIGIKKPPAGADGLPIK